MATVSRTEEFKYRVWVPVREESKDVAYGRILNGNIVSRAVRNKKCVRQDVIITTATVSGTGRNIILVRVPVGEEK